MAYSRWRIIRPAFAGPQVFAPEEEDLSKGILEAIDMDIYRVKRQAEQRVHLADEEVETDPVPTDGGGHRPDAKLDQISNIINSFNDLFGKINWQDANRIRRLIANDIARKVAANPAYQNAKQNSDKHNARIEHNKALGGAIVGLMRDDTELIKQFSYDGGFKRGLADTIFAVTYNIPGPSSS